MTPRRFWAWYVLPVAVLLAARVAPLVSGAKTLVLRDVLHHHYPMKWSQAQAFLDGRLPLIDPARFGGQALLGNPNATVLYPDSLLLLVASPLWVLNARFWVHLLLAPAAAYWMGRAWGLGRRASWAVAATYAASGFLLSNLNLHNLIAGVALTPALVAATLELASRRRPGRAFLAVGVLWALLLLAGDPMTAVVALLLAATAPLTRSGFRRWDALRCATAGGLGTLVAAPQLVEFARILGQSYRGHWQYSAEGATVGSWNPATALEWLVPMAFGRPDLTFWGNAWFAGESPLFFSLAPGALALVLVLAAGLPRSRPAVWAWGAVGVGIFLALGRYNPAIAWLASTAGGGLLRFPIKVWPLVAVGGALLCGLGFERLLRGEARRLATAGFTALALFYGALWVSLQTSPRGGPLLDRVLPGVVSATLAEQVRLQWSGVCLISLAAVAGLALLLRLARRRPAAAGLALALHVGVQLLLLQALLPTDDASFYRRPPPVEARIPAGAVMVQGAADGLFGEAAPSPDTFPDSRMFWLTRKTWSELQPWAAIRWGKRAEMALSPEGLDTFVARAAADALGQLTDVGRVRLLRAVGVEYLVLDRPLAPPAAVEVEDLGPVAIGRGRPYRLYRFPDNRRDVWLAHEVVWAEHLNAALEALIGPGFDPASTVVLAGAGAAESAPSGELTVVSDEAERVIVDTSSPDGGVVVTRRAFLPIYRATIDGRPARPVVANLYRLAVRVPAGAHRVELAVDRRPLAASLVAAALALAALVLAAWRLARRSTGPRSMP